MPLLLFHGESGSFQMVIGGFVMQETVFRRNHRGPSMALLHRAFRITIQCVVCFFCRRYPTLCHHIPQSIAYNPFHHSKMDDLDWPGTSHGHHTHLGNHDPTKTNKPLHQSAHRHLVCYDAPRSPAVSDIRYQDRKMGKTRNQSPRIFQALPANACFQIWSCHMK